MGYSWSYFEDEVKDGFFVPSIIKKCWAYGKSIYDALDEICKQHGLVCTAGYGTMLGAVRHGGYIPWDDDLDVEMLRADYAKLMKIEEGETSRKQTFFLDDTIRAKDVELNAIRRFLTDKGLFNPLDKWDDCFGFPFNGPIDIFIHDYVPQTEEEKNFYNDVVNLFASMVSFAKEIEKNENSEMKNALDVQGFYERLKKIEDGFGIQFTDDVPIAIQLTDAMERFCGAYTEEECDERAMVADWSKRPNLLFSKDEYDSIEVPFENETIRIPIGYDHILRNLYSDFMNPVMAKSGHNYPYFVAYEEALWKQQGMKLLRYEYDGNEVENNRKWRQKKISLKEELISSVGLLLEAHNFIRANGKDSEQISAVLDTLGQCQELAISLGEQIEARVVAPEGIVSILEQYCDYVYGLYQSICERVGAESVTDGDKELDMQALADFEESLKACLDGEIREKKEVVFLVYKSSYWKSLHTLWEKMSGEEDVNVTVIPVPYYYKNFYGKPEEDMQIEVEGYPAEVTLTSYEEYNFESHHPDILFYQFPYDEYSYALSLHPFFYARNLRQYVEKMVFVTPFILREITEEDERAIYTLKWFLQTPGLVYADEILTQSEQMKKIYEKILDEFTGHDVSLDWKERISGANFPLKEWEEKRRLLIQNCDTGEIYTKGGQPAEKTLYDEVVEISDDWVKKIFGKDGSRKKIILYYVSGSVLFQYREKAIEKIEQVLNVAKNNQKNIVFLWYTDPYAEQILRKRVPSIWDSYQEILAMFRDEGIGILDESGDYTLAVNLCDAFYGDAGTVLSECRMQGKPILWENPEISVDEGDS